MRRIVLVACLAACSSKPPKTNGGHGTAPPDAGAAPAQLDDAGRPVVTGADCDAVIDHVLAVMMDDLRARKPEDEWPTEDQVAEKRAVLSDEFMDQCLTLDRAVIDCMQKAADPPALAECATVE